MWEQIMFKKHKTDKTEYSVEYRCTHIRMYIYIHVQYVIYVMIIYNYIN